MFVPLLISRVGYSIYTDAEYIRVNLGAAVDQAIFWPGIVCLRPIEALVCSELPKNVITYHNVLLGLL